ncbi:hypothetical protein E2C01_002662 [Portunus trituberculatus]|uniref:Uncharacterized protein n=1 Tax=Portunus trituberculatus TaxID=210409 RepID=A0A5B7CKC5_PORTR|nr:hypothetical protein [Portunus trituberculatus]
MAGGCRSRWKGQVRSARVRVAACYDVVFGCAQVLARVPRRNECLGWGVDVHAYVASCIHMCPLHLLRQCRLKEVFGMYTSRLTMHLTASEYLHPSLSSSG